MANRGSNRLKWLPISQLELDPLNPRLVVPKKIGQLELMTILYEDEALDELVPSFLENGYFEEEPLVVYPVGKKYRTVEGNRRLATIKLLLDETLRRRVRVEGWPIPTKTQADRLRVVPCVVYETRDELMPFLGFRHITGAKKWEPFQRARFVADLLTRGQSLDEIQDLIGDTTRATKKLYQDFVIYGQITDDLGLPSKPIRERFSLLEVSLGQRPIKSFLAMPGPLPRKAVKSLVPDSHLDELRELATWVFGNEESPPVIRESRDISARLARVVANAEALDHLRRSGDLEGAFELTDGEYQYLVKRLTAGERAVRDAAGLIAIYVKDAVVRSAVKRLGTLVDGLKKQIRQ
ncbi:MAG: ParB N-terminal domain-containing protein [Actinomycetota bacterium]